MPQLRRPVPADFAENRRRMSYAELCRHYSAGKPTVTKWIDALGLERRTNIRPAPADFAERNAVMSIAKLAEHYGTSYKVIRRWINEGGLKPTPNVRPFRAVPDDWAAVAPTMQVSALKRHYHCGTELLRKWVAITGIGPKEREPAAKPVKASRAGTVKGPGLGFKNPWGNLSHTRASSIYDDAADIIRAKCPVYRCNDKGGYDPKGKLWRVGWSILTGAELLERAERTKARAA